MNRKLAKKLRRMARAATEGAPAVAYEHLPRGYWRVHPQSTRGAYLKLKREHRSTHA